MSNVVHINVGWSSMDQLIKKHGISQRTGWNWLKAGKVEKRETPDGCMYRAVQPNLQCKFDENSPVQVTALSPVQVTALLARIDALERKVDRLDALERKVAELEVVRDELTLRLESIEHAHDWHVAVDGILEKRRKKLARLTRSLG
jgi:hypothetical protein